MNNKSHRDAGRKGDDGMVWMGLGCDVCGFGSVENLEDFNPRRPCPECGNVAVREEVEK